MRLPRLGTPRQTDHRRLGDEDLMALVRTGDWSRSRWSTSAMAALRTRSPTACAGAASRPKMWSRRRSCRRGGGRRPMTRRAGACGRGCSGSCITGPSMRCGVAGRTAPPRRCAGGGVRDRLRRPRRRRGDRARPGVGVRGALEELPKDQTKVIELAYFGGFTHTEIADMLGIPIGTVKGRMRLGLAKLRDSFEPMEGIAP